MIVDCPRHRPWHSVKCLADLEDDIDSLVAEERNRMDTPGDLKVDFIS